MPSAKVVIHFWSDYVCPFCYLQTPVLDEIRSVYGERVDIRWRDFELRPAPEPTLEPYGEYLRTTWTESVYPLAAERGMTLYLPSVQPRSRKAFEAERFARDHSRGNKMRQALFQAFFELGSDIGDVEVLAGIGRVVGLNASRLQAVLERGDYAQAVADDRREAERLGITGVPAMLVQASGAAPAEGSLLIGAEPYEKVRDAVMRALDVVPA